MTATSGESGYRRRRETTKRHAASFWIALAITGVIGIEIIDLAVNASTTAVDAAIGAPARDE